MHNLRSIGPLALLLAAVACADRATSPVAPDAPNAIIGGTPTGTDFGAVGAPMFDFGKDGIDPDDWYCTGSLISPTVFLTAAHCLDFLPKGAQIYVTFQPTTEDAPKYIVAATGYQADPLYGFNQNDPHDIGVIFLPATKTRGIAPLQLPTAGYLDVNRSSSSQSSRLRTSGNRRGRRISCGTGAKGRRFGWAGMQRS